MKKMINARALMHTEKKGFSLVELLIAVVVLGILSSMLIAAGTASQQKARLAVAQNDLDGIKNSVYQALMAHPNISKWCDDKEVTGYKKDTLNSADLMGWLNSELDDVWRLAPVAGNTKSSGLMYQTATQQDPWGNPYGVFIYTNNHAAKIPSDDGNGTLGTKDSVFYIVVASPGRNGTGVGNGETANNMSADGKKLNAGGESDGATQLAVNNTDGIDDVGVILRMKNGTLRTASFGTDQSTLGSLEGVQWIFGEIGTTTGGHYYNYQGTGTVVTEVSSVGSIDWLYDDDQIKTLITPVMSGEDENAVEVGRIVGAFGAGSAGTGGTP